MINSLVLPIVLLLLCGTEVLGVPMTQVCPPNKPLRLSPMSQLDLKCGSLCEMSGTKYEWVKTRGVGKEGVVRMESDESSMAIKSVYYGDGGTYKCSCLPDGPQCEQTVYIIPTMEFIASSKLIYSGDQVELTCTVHMSEPSFPTITTKSGRGLSKHDVDEITIDEHTVMVEVIILEQYEEKEDYVCMVSSFGEDKQLVEKVQKNLSIYSYEPPEIIYTNEFNIASDKDFGITGKLVCKVLSIADAGTTVKWLFGGKEVPLGQGKFSSQVHKEPKDTLEFVLLVDNVQEADVGAYTCQLHSRYRMEEEHQAWINCKEGLTGTDEKHFYYIVYIVGIALCALALWVYVCKYVKRKRKDGGLLSHHSQFQPSWVRSNDGVTRRKLV